MTRTRTSIAAAALTVAVASVHAAPVLEPTTQKFIDSLAGSPPV